MPARHEHRRGFTLLEVMIALAVSGIVVLAAGQLFGVVAGAAERVPTLVRANDSVRLRENLLHELFAQAELGADSTRRFIGSADSLSFDSWCRAAGGWSERCQVSLVLHRSPDSVRLDAEWGGQRINLLSGKGAAGFFYMESGTGADRWLRRWGHAISPPRAVLLIIGGGTLLLRIGERG